jgi:DNA-binding NtrC family response regulator
MPRKILLVDDDEATLDLLGTTLEKNGYAVTRAKDPAQARWLWEDAKEPFDLLLTDVRLEAQDDGFMLATKLLESNPNVPVMFISGDPDCFASPAIQRFGDSPFLSKPFDLKKMLVSVKKIIENPPAAQ